jgi:TolA-binding protein
VPVAAPIEPPRPLASHARRRPSAPASVAPDPESLSAAALLADAGRARGEGQRDRAIALYRRLQREFPGTPEAQVSSLPLGRLLLDGRASRAALAAFDGYLRDAPRGALVAEALYGRGRALELLNEHEDERRTWQRLLAEHAGSAYVPHARERLAALR